MTTKKIILIVAIAVVILAIAGVATFAWYTNPFDETPDDLIIIDTTTVTIIKVGTNDIDSSFMKPAVVKKDVLNTSLAEGGLYNTSTHTADKELVRVGADYGASNEYIQENAGYVISYFPIMLQGTGYSLLHFATEVEWKNSSNEYVNADDIISSKVGDIYYDYDEEKGLSASGLADPTYGYDYSKKYFIQPIETYTKRLIPVYTWFTYPDELVDNKYLNSDFRVILKVSGIPVVYNNMLTSGYGTAGNTISWSRTPTSTDVYYLAPIYASSIDNLEELVDAGMASKFTGNGSSSLALTMPATDPFEGDVNSPLGVYKQMKVFYVNNGTLESVSERSIQYNYTPPAP